MIRPSIRALAAAGIALALAACGDARTPTATNSPAPQKPSFNVAPVGNIDAQTFGLYEGFPIAITAIGSLDPDHGHLTFHWDFGDGGTADGYQVVHTYADNGVYTVTLTVTNSRGLHVSVSAQITVLNVKPWGGSLSVPANLQEGVPFLVSAPGWTDAAADLAAGLQYSFDCGGGGWTPFSTSNSWNCVGRANNSVRRIRVRVMDKDGGIKQIGVDRIVANVPPLILLSAVEQHGAFVTAALIFSDVPADRNSTITYDWGDGFTSTVTGAAPGSVYAQSHRYAARGHYTVTMTVTDVDGGVSSPSTTNITI